VETSINFLVYVKERIATTKVQHTTRQILHCMPCSLKLKGCERTFHIKKTKEMQALLFQ